MIVGMLTCDGDMQTMSPDLPAGSLVKYTCCDSCDSCDQTIVDRYAAMGPDWACTLPPPVCGDDTFGSLAGAGASCAMIVGMLTCDGDMQTMSPDLPAGSLVKYTCCDSCDSCDQTIVDRYAAMGPDWACTLPMDSTSTDSGSHSSSVIISSSTEEIVWIQKEYGNRNCNGPPEQIIAFDVVVMLSTQGQTVDACVDGASIGQAGKSVMFLGDCSVDIYGSDDCSGSMDNMPLFDGECDDGSKTECVPVGDMPNNAIDMTDKSMMELMELMGSGSGSHSGSGHDDHECGKSCTSEPNTCDKLVEAAMGCAADCLAGPHKDEDKIKDLAMDLDCCGSMTWAECVADMAATESMTDGSPAWSFGSVLAAC